jgi:hypothetical protein
MGHVLRQVCTKVLLNVKPKTGAGSIEARFWFQPEIMSEVVEASVTGDVTERVWLSPRIRLGQLFNSVCLVRV